MINNIYYFLKPILPRSLQIGLRRWVIRRKLPRVADIWPIDEGSTRTPQGWKGWPDGKQFALVLTHDVDTQRGQERCRDLAALETGLGFRSSFNFVPERYSVSRELREYLTSSGFEVGVHGLYHDGKYFNSRAIFRERAQRINNYLREWGATGYRSPSMLHNLEWFHDLNIRYDASTFDTDPFEPQSDGVGTIFPFWVEGGTPGKGYVELPYTLPQDFTLFILMENTGIDIWKRKLDWLARHGGMALINVHPDYMAFGEKIGLEEYPARYYADFLQYVKTTYRDAYWPALPKDVTTFIRSSLVTP